MDSTNHMKFSRLARWASRVAGQPAAFLVALCTVAIWALTGPLFQFSDTWQLVINTGTTVVTFLMVFLIQHSQNRDTMAIHLKLDELVRAIHAAQNTVLNLDELEEEELSLLLQKYQQMGKEARLKADAKASSSRELNRPGKAPSGA